jgi:hypothetical protein
MIHCCWRADAVGSVRRHSGNLAQAIAASREIAALRKPLDGACVYLL